MSWAKVKVVLGVSLGCSAGLSSFFSVDLSYFSSVGFGSGGVAAAAAGSVGLESSEGCAAAAGSSGLFLSWAGGSGALVAGC